MVLLNGMSDFIEVKIVRADLFVFIMLSIALTLVAEKLPAKFYDHKNWLYRERRWEEGGKIYERMFFVKRWKPYMPEISDVLFTRFSKKHLQKSDSQYLKMFLLESCKAELTHWVIILSSVFFLCWGIGTMLRFLLLAVLLNLPYIIMQRYNRPRLIRLITIKQHSLDALELCPSKA